MTAFSKKFASKDSLVRRTALVVDGMEGIGPSICRKMKELGYIVAVTYRDEKKALAWQLEMENDGYLFFIYKCAAENPEECQLMVTEVAEDIGQIQILINNTCASYDCGMQKMREAASKEINKIINVTCSVIDGMLDGCFGRIINISPVKKRDRHIQPLAYARSGVHAFMNEIAQEVAKKGITINSIFPVYSEACISEPAYIFDNANHSLSVGGSGKPESIAQLVSFLASEEAWFITGAVAS